MKKTLLSWSSPNWFARASGSASGRKLLTSDETSQSVPFLLRKTTTPGFSTKILREVGFHNHKSTTSSNSQPRTVHNCNWTCFEVELIFAKLNSRHFWALQLQISWEITSRSGLKTSPASGMFGLYLFFGIFSFLDDSSSSMAITSNSVEKKALGLILHFSIDQSS